MNPVDLLLPSSCPGCARPGRACPPCAAAFDNLFEVERGAIDVPAYAMTPYAGPARRLLLAYKERGRRDLTGVMGRAVPRALDRVRERLVMPPVVLVPAPSRWWAVRRRGGNHVLRALRSPPGAPVADVLRMSAWTADSVGLGALDRRRNLRGRVRARGGAGAVVLVDDVITTGVTAGVCLEALRAAGWTPVAVLAFTATV